MSEYKLMYDCFRRPETEGIFSKLATMAVPWSSTTSAAILDNYYYNLYSRTKIASDFIQAKAEAQAAGVLANSDVITVANMCLMLFSQRWNRLYDIWEIEYNPINNYDMVESYDEETERDYGRTDTRTDNLTESRTLNLQHARTGSEGENGSNSRQVDDKISGFNSSSAQNANLSDESGSYLQNHTYNTTDTDSGTDSTTRGGTVQNAAGGTDTETNSHTLTRVGNIGVTTTQQMLESEMGLWKWSFFENVVFPDVDKILTIPIY